MILAGCLQRARTLLVESGIAPDEASLDAELLAREVLGWDRARLLASLNEPEPAGFEEVFSPLLARRQRREPIAYIIGRREFWGLDFEVTPDVLIPRAETEFIVEEALRIPGIESRPCVLAADIGTGSGCVAVALAVSLPATRIVATDLSAAALRVASRNVERHGVGSRVTLVQADLMAGLRGPFDLVVSNPPYVPTPSVGGLQHEIRRHEPRQAFDGGIDGLALVRRLLEEASTRLRPGGWLIFEFGYSQEEDVEAAAATCDGLEVHHVAVDLQGIPRTAVIQSKPTT